MENFTITTRLKTKEYAKVILIALYRKPGFIIAAIFGFYFMTAGLLHYYENTPYFKIILGIFLLLSPFIITLIAVKQFKSNENLHNDILYTFEDKLYRVHTLTVKAEFAWAHIIKLKEISNFIILYHSKKTGNFIDKTALTPDQLEFIKSKIEKR
jgi:hypothetical protein